MRKWLGPLVAVFIVGGIGLVLALNLETHHEVQKASPPPEPAPAATVQAAPKAPESSAPFREYPIGDEREQNHMLIAAVWFPAVEVEGLQPIAGSDVIHLEADIHATSANPNGFARGEFVPYLRIGYRIEPAAGGAALTGDLMPMVASDGPHYGASVRLPKPGRYRLTYHIEPPSAGGMGRHHDPITGVAPWWTPFDVTFDWDYPGPQGESSTTTTR